MGERILILTIGDIILAILSVYGGFVVRFSEIPEFHGLLFSNSPKILLFTAVVLFSTFVVELYTSDNQMDRKNLLVRICLLQVLSFILLTSIYYIVPSLFLGRGIMAISLCIFGVSQYIWHIGYSFCINLPGLARRVLILGTGPLAEKMGNLIVSYGNYYVLAGYVNCQNEAVQVPVGSILGNGGGLYQTALKARVHKIVVSLTEQRGTIPLRDMLDCKLNGIEVMDSSSFYERVTGKLMIENIRPSSLIYSDGFKVTYIKTFIKRLCDIVLAAMVLVFALPFMPLIALLVKLDSKGPVFFKQVRVGQGEKNFVLYKFRTMGQDAEIGTGAVWAQKNDPRVTRVGGFLRKTRLDELPQLFNVLRGDISFIGPRPERPEFVEKLKSIIPYYSERHAIKPGLTGWAQVRYSYGASVEDAIEKLKYDLYYIKNISFIFDMSIVIDTVKVVLFAKGGR